MSSEEAEATATTTTTEKAEAAEASSSDDEEQDTSTHVNNNNSRKAIKELHGTDIAEIMNSEGPIVKCVILRCEPNSDATSTTKPSYDHEEEKKEFSAGDDDNQKETTDTNNSDDNDDKQEEKIILDHLIEEIEIDTTPSKNMVSKTLGGPFTFVGQYEEEGIVLIALRDEDEEKQEEEQEEQEDDDDDVRSLSISQLRQKCQKQGISLQNMLEKNDLIQALQKKKIEKQQQQKPYNPHVLQPPFENLKVRGDILILKVAPIEDMDDNKLYEVDSNSDSDDDDDNKNDDNNEEDSEEDGDHEMKEDNGSSNEKTNDDEMEENDEKGATTSLEKNGDSNDRKDTSKISSVVGDEKEHTATLEDDAATPLDTNDNDNVNESDKENENNDDAAWNAMHVPTNHEFFLNYTKQEYIAFASRKDIIPPSPEEEEEDEDEYIVLRNEDGEEEEMTEEEEKNAMLNLVMSEVLRKFRGENGRGPNTKELLEIRSSVAEQLGVEVATFDAIEQHNKARKRKRKRKKQEDTNSSDNPTGEKKQSGEDKGAGSCSGDDDDDDDDFEEPDNVRRKRVKFSHDIVESEDLKQEAMQTANDDDVNK